MINRHSSRLVVEAAAFVLVSVMLFTGTSTSSAPGDRKAPTAPTNLVVTAITETTIAMSWSPSTDDSGKFSYKVRISNLDNPAYNSVANVSQSQTTYTARFLSPDDIHTLSVYAVDAAGNRSADSNSVTVRTLADTSPPTAPTLKANVLGPSQVQLSWTKSIDNVPNNCCNYAFILNGSPLTENINWEGGQMAVIRHLTPATLYQFSINVSDYGGNMVTSNSVTMMTESSDDTVPPTAPTSLHLVGDNGCAEVWLGWVEATDDVDAQEDIEYEIYVNGVLSPLPVSAGVDTDFVYGTVAGENTFYVKAVDRSGNISGPSKVLKLFLWPC